ncbi:MAG TPA: GDP-mannose 4,6-dehydratase [Thermoanaerobaculia bacterium]|nr:GDP-mannose 4,6-dehydratase [Thermoanaerobaculia bacterium]
MRLLITGGAGFIGSHLAELYLQRGDEVSIIDDLSTGSIDNIQHLKKHPRFEYTIDSVRNFPVLAELVDRADVIVHLAAAVGVQLIVESPVRTIETNVRGTEVVLELANKKKKKVLVASTSEVYGLSDKVPFREDGNLVLGATNKGRWSYACSKAIDEFLALAYWHEKKLPTIIVRLFNTVGPRQTGQYGMVVPRFVKQALSERPITVFGDGTQTRCFCHVSDVVNALMKLIDHPASVGEVFNIGSTEEVSIQQLAESVRRLARSSSDIIYVPYDEAYEAGFEDMPRRVPDTSKVEKLIGFRTTHNLEDIVRSVIEFERGVAEAAKPQIYAEVRA